MPTNMLASLFNGSPANVSLGSGAAENAKQTLMAREKYRQYVIEAQTNGENPMDYETWMAQAGNK